MPSSNWTFAVIDWIALPCLALLAGVLIYRKYHREFAFFFAYVVATDLIGITRLLASRNPGKAYYYVYWISDIGVAVFAFLATYELFIKRLFPAFYRVRFFRYLFPASALVITLLGAATAIYGGKLAALLITVRVYEFMRAAALFFFVALMVFMGREWKREEFGIAFGFSLDVYATFATLLLLSGNSRNELVNRLPAGAYDIACVVWIYCFWSAPRAPLSPPLEQMSPEKLHEARKWEQSLKDFLHQDKR